MLNPKHKTQNSKILVIDNYDSFTYNLVHYLEDLNCDVTVYRNDEFDLEEIESFDKIVLSPGPGIPDEAGLLKDVIKMVKRIPGKKGLGVHYWEPQGARSWSHYGLSCWGDDGRPTKALDAFK